jgi:hypothetical protein
MEAVRSAGTTEERLAVYRRTADQALAEIDELQSDILAAQVRLSAMLARVKALESLIGAVHELVGHDVEIPVGFRAVHIEGPDSRNGKPLPQRLRRRDRSRLPAVDASAS